MKNDDLEIARRLLAGGWTPQRQRRVPRHDLVPASFREIDGSELARQYATHRKIESATSLGQPARGLRLAPPREDRAPARGMPKLGPPTRTPTRPS